ncbi:unnamed protein product [Enterobius vermicularis]|uniref:NADH-ubiquinone oxidoreductase B17 subunit n=1 Tax=Enterobius vermicularis TaxID=51028 RepID=A0A0N4V410_ENTVE|nr:unnamed protein product [Enterobius vermicularis]
MVVYILRNTLVKWPRNSWQNSVARTIFTKRKALTVPAPAVYQWKPPPDQKGHLKYERYWSNNGKYLPQVKVGDTFSRALFGRISETFELYPIYFLAGVYLVTLGTFLYVTTHTCDFNTSKKTWPVIRDKYWKYHTVLYDPTGKTHTRFPLMEQLLDEIEAASKQRREEDNERFKIEH